MNWQTLEIDPHEARQLVEQGQALVWLDCREQEEHDFVHLPDSVLLPMSEIGQRVMELEPYRQQPVVVYCHHGVRSLRVAAWLKQQGFANVRSLAGGIDAWSVEIDPQLPRY